MLTELQKQKLPRLFAVHDRNHDGVLTRSDFEEYTRLIASTRGWGPGSSEYTELLSRFLTFWKGLEHVADTNDSGKVTLTDWLAHWDRILATPGMYEQVAAPIAEMVFAMLDQDDDGAITAEEYAFMYRFGGLDPAAAAATFARLDLDQDGRLSIDEIMTLLDQFFRSDDPADPGNAFFGVVPVGKVNV